MDEILKCAGEVGRRDDEAVAGALNEPLFELVGEALTLPTTAPPAFAPRIDVEGCRLPEQTAPA